MNFQRFKEQFQNRPFFSSHDAMAGEKDPQLLRNQLSRWQKKGLILPLRKGVYVFNRIESKIELDPFYAANIIYEPSYISLESALSFHGLIPEGVVSFTSITTRKTKEFSNSLGHFSYQHIKPEAFRGFRKEPYQRGSFFMAEAEKAIVDFVYLRLSCFNVDPGRVLEYSYRFQGTDILKTEKLLEFGSLFGCKKLMKVLSAIKKRLDEAPL